MNDLSKALAFSEAGKSFHHKKKYVPAIEEFRKAVEEYKSAGEFSAVAEMRNNIAVCLQMLGKPEESLMEIRGTSEVFAKAGKLEYQAMALGNEASALEDLKRFDEALNLYRQADELLESEQKSEIRAIILKRISSLELRKGDQMGSLASMSVALKTDPNPGRKEKSLKNILSKFFSFITK